MSVSHVSVKAYHYRSCHEEWNAVCEHVGMDKDRESVSGSRHGCPLCVGGCVCVGMKDTAGQYLCIRTHLILAAP